MAARMLATASTGFVTSAIPTNGGIAGNFHLGSFTISGWIYLVSLPGASAGQITGIQDATSQWAIGISTSANGNRFYFWDGTDHFGALVAEIGRWYYIAWAMNSLAGTATTIETKLYVARRYVPALELTVPAPAVLALAAGGTFAIGGDAAQTDAPFDGIFFNFKVWNDVFMSYGEIVKEQFSLAPTRQEKLWGWYPMTYGKTDRGRDLGPLNHRLTENLTISDAREYPYNWFPALRF